jgi:enterobactin synthetase component D / holo-[acyl-carrier protein] synthase
MDAWLTSLSTCHVATVASMAPVEDHWGALLPGESDTLSRAVERRRNEFSTGRHLCRQLMSHMGLESDQSIPVGSNRAPVWPPSIVGSITHTTTLCLAMLAPSDRYLGIGVDLEETNRVSDGIWTRVATDSEQRLAGTAPITRAELTAALFSTKEAVFKAIHPLSEDFLEFRDVTIAFNWSTGSFDARCAGRLTSDRYARRGEGAFSMISGHVISAFVIPIARSPSLQKVAGPHRVSPTSSSSRASSRACNSSISSS